MGKKLTLEQFISKSKGIHGDMYDYSKVEYVNSSTKVIINCPIHGEWLSLPYNHLMGKGCTKCGFIKGNKVLKERLVKERALSIIQPEDYKLIRLNNGNLVKVDNEDFDRVKNYPWCNKDGYAYNSELGRMHRFIMNAPNGMLVDHKKAEDILDNRKSNLRLATRAQNSMNSRSKKGSSSKFKGVSWNSLTKKWKLQIAFEGVNKHIGEFIDEVECAKLYDRKALELFGEFAYLNFPELKEEYLKEIENETQL